MKAKNLRSAAALMMAVAATSCGGVRGQPTLREPLRIEVQAEQGMPRKLGKRYSRSILAKGEERNEISAFGIARKGGDGLAFSIPRKNAPAEAVEMAGERATSKITAEIDMAGKRVRIKVMHADGSQENSEVKLNGAFKRAERALVAAVPGEDNGVSFYFVPVTNKGNLVRQRGWTPGHRIEVRFTTITSVSSTGPANDSPTTEESSAKGIEVTSREVRISPTPQRQGNR
ncbi:MAG: hypothetical protein ABII71_02780 [Candidatus Micrarchaeota archaeon]